MILELLDLFDWIWVATAVSAVLTYLLVNTFVKTRNLPPGPIPLPVLGNLLELRGEVDVDDLVKKWRAKYGDIFTIWLGLDPMVVVCSWDKTKEALITMKNAFSGRPIRYMDAIFVDGHDDIIVSDFGPAWETLRKILTLAVRRYSVSEKLPLLVDDVVNQTISFMLAEKGSFDPNDYMYFTIYNILASTAFGKRYTLENEEFQELKNTNDEIGQELGFGSIVDIYPILRHFYPGREKKIHKLVDTFKNAISKEYKQHQKTYQKGIIRDFTDACLAAKEEAELEDRNTAQYFNDGNMIMVINDLFTAGTDTTRLTLSWTLLYLIKYPEIQEKVRAEILENIGDRIPLQDDRLKCPYTQAVLTETLRLKSVVSFTLEHKATLDTKLGGYAIPKDTSIVFHLKSQHMEAEFFKDPEVFRPERFLEEDGSFMTNTRFTGYLPFGLGRRACPGEKLAKADWFLILSGLLKKLRFSLPKGDKVDLEPLKILSVKIPKPFKLNVEKI